MNAFWHHDFWDPQANEPKRAVQQRLVETIDGVALDTGGWLDKDVMT